MLDAESINLSQLEYINEFRYYCTHMIKSFGNKATEELFGCRFTRKFPSNLHRVMWRKLAIIDAAEKNDDLLIPPGNRLEKLSGDRKGEFSIRINDQWRVCFKWKDGNCSEVGIFDYH